MKRNAPLTVPVFAVLLAALFAASCVTGGKAAEEEPDFLKDFDISGFSVPPGFRFEEAAVPDLSIPPDVGSLSEFPGEGSAALTGAFTDAYRGALLRGLPLAGVLGGDRVHLWPASVAEGESQGRIQNWQSAGETAKNSWGVPGLVLAIGSAETVSENYRVFTVSGNILNQYGKNPAPHIGNGVAGYGYPLGETVYDNGKASQFFSGGIISDDGGAAVFTPGAAGGASGQRISDGPAFQYNFDEPWNIETAGGTIAATGLTIETFDGGAAVAVAVRAEGLPQNPRLLAGPFLAAILKSETVRLDGSVDLKRDVKVRASSAYLKALLEGFALYGLPLTDALPLKRESGFIEAQRFGRGWILSK
jgi:hypothetical protein